MTGGGAIMRCVLTDKMEDCKVAVLSTGVGINYGATDKVDFLLIVETVKK